MSWHLYFACNPVIRRWMAKAIGRGRKAPFPFLDISVTTELVREHVPPECASTRAVIQYPTAQSSRCKHPFLRLAQNFSRLTRRSECLEPTGFHDFGHFKNLWIFKPVSARAREL